MRSAFGLAAGAGTVWAEHHIVQGVKGEIGRRGVLPFGLAARVTVPDIQAGSA